nr:hypothetical protein [Parafrankia discariae]
MTQIEGAGGFVEEQHGRLLGERAGDHDPSRLAAGELVDVPVGERGEIEQVERLVDAPLVRGGGPQPAARGAGCGVRPSMTASVTVSEKAPGEPWGT